jgi:Galactose oxidase, central domain/Kelch motif
MNMQTQSMRVLRSLAGTLFLAASTLARRVAFSLLFLGVALVLVQATAGTLFAFENTGSLGQARSDHSATLLPNGKVLVAGGFTASISYSNLASCELYDPASGTWTATGSLATKRSGHTITLLATGKVLVAGGFGDNGRLKSAELYDPATGNWTTTGSLATARDSSTATLLSNGKVLAVGGVSDNGPPAFNLASAELYDPATGTWAPTGSLAVPRVSHTATLLPNGKVLVAGGFNSNDGSLASAELYDPAIGTWAPTGSLGVTHTGHTATLLPNGKVLVVAGQTNGSPSAIAELYDPATGTWTGAGSLATARESHTATLLTNGKVLVAGGRNGAVVLASCELYDPSAPPPPTPTPTPTPTPARSLNISTRARVQTGDNVMIGGFIVTGNVSKKVIVRALGPSLAKSGLTGVLADPMLELHGPDGSLLLADDNWRDNPDQALLIQASGIPPEDDRESAIVATLPPAGYTAIVKGKSNGTGLGLVEVYDLEQSTDSKLANLSTRAMVETGDNVLIGGFILGGNSGAPHIFVRAIGPSLARLHVPNPLPDPTLELRDGNGALIAFDDNWNDNPAQASQIVAAGMRPQDDLESVIAISPSPGAYTAIVAGKNSGTGVGLVEIYNLQ